ncbi:MAG: polysaccharide biosynthesis/export family protein [Blastocatellia bacterium]
MNKVILRRKLTVLCGLWLVVCGSALAQQPERSSAPVRERAGQEVGSSSGVLASTEADYRIGIADVLDIEIEDAPELSGQVRVNNAGNIALPTPLGMLRADQLTIEELSSAIARLLREKDYLKQPRVVVSVRQYLSRSIFIQGAVRSPGVYQIEGRPSLLKLIILAGGLAENHGSTAFIIRETKKPQAQSQAQNATAATGAEADQEEHYEFLRANISGLLNGNFEQNVLISPGDIINIPPAGVFFVGGEVRKPGSFVLKDRTTLRQALAMAEGTNFKAALNRGVIFREDPATGQRKEIRVDVAAVQNGKQDDLIIQANDVIIVPNSKSKSVGGTLLSTLGMAGVQRAVLFR